MTEMKRALSSPDPHPEHLRDGSCECECNRCYRPNVRSGACICLSCTDECHDHDDRQVTAPARTPS